MVDSTNYNISNVLIRDIPYFYNKFKKFKEGCYCYLYKGCQFIYYLTSCNLSIKTTTYKILGTTTPTLSDYPKFIEKLKSIIEEVINLTTYELNLCRIDYFVDLKLSSEEEVKEVFALLQKHSTKYKYMKQKEVYKTSIHLITKSGSYNINFYDKYKQLQDKEGINDPKFKNVVRFELQVKNRKLKRLEKENNIQRDIKDYFSKSLMEDIYFRTLEDYFYKGDYVTLLKGIDIIKKSNYSQTVKLNLIKFLKTVNLIGISYVKRRNGRGISHNTFNNYINSLNKLGINPICLSDNSKFNKIENLFKQLKRTAEEKYFK